MNKPAKSIPNVVRLSPSIARWVILGIVLGLTQVTGVYVIYYEFSTPASTPLLLWFNAAYEVFDFLSLVVFPFVGGFVGQADLTTLPMKRIFVWTFVGCLTGTFLAEPFLSVSQTPFGTPSIASMMKYLPGYLGAYGWAAVAHLFGVVLLLVAFPLIVGAFAFLGATARVSCRRTAQPKPPSA
jgi:hypothetical protein